MRLLLCLLILSIGACTPTREKQANSVIQISKELIENADSLYLSELCDKITYIPLETSDSSLIGKAPQFYITKTKILVSSHKCPLLVFDRETGKFLNQVGHKGDDPEGYTDDGWGNIPFWIDHTNETIYFIKDYNALIKYNIDGTFIGKVKPPEEVQIDLSGCYLYIHNDTVFCHNKYVCNDNTPMLLAFNGTTGDLHWQIKPKKPLLPTYSEINTSEYLYGFTPKYGGNMYRFYFDNNRSFIYSPNAPTLWQDGDALCFKENFIDTIYTVQHGSLIANKTIDLNEFKWPYTQRCSEEVSSKTLSVNYLLPSKQYIYFYLSKDLYGKNSKSYIAIYDKVRQSTIIKMNDLLINDIDHSIPICLRGTTFDNLFYGVVQSSDIIAFEQTVGRKLPKSLSSINSDEDNPVIMILEYAN